MYMQKGITSLVDLCFTAITMPDIAPSHKEIKINHKNLSFDKNKNKAK